MKATSIAWLVLKMAIEAFVLVLSTTILFGQVKLEKLEKMDKTSKLGAWTQEYLQVIQDMPNTHSSLLADYLGLSVPEFKPWVRKLKALGLTESVHPGYKLSPRGEKVLEALRQKA